MNFLIDYNMRGQAALLWGTLAAEGMKGIDSLEQVIREENTGTSLPVVTIGNKERLDEKRYREQCASRLVEILFDLENYMGVGRLYIP
jgi:hypothetical protein